MRQRLRDLFIPEDVNIPDNGPQFIARDFKDFIRICGMTHVKTSPYYPHMKRSLLLQEKNVKFEGILYAK